MERRIERTTSRTAEWTCVARAASTLENNVLYKSNDELALKLLPFPINSLIKLPFYRKLHFQFGAPKGIYEYVIARTKYFDAAFTHALQQEFEQIVILGAGYDTRAIRLQGQQTQVKIFEVDSEKTQNRKKSLFEKKGIEIPANLTFIPMDFQRDSLREKLWERGFLCTRSLFILEGVSMYLDKASVDSLFRTIADSMDGQSLFAFDYTYPKPIGTDKGRYGEAKLRNSTARVHESFGFGIEKGGLEAFLSAYGYEAVNHLEPEDIEARYFRDSTGKIIGRVNGIHCLATVAKV